MPWSTWQSDNILDNFADQPGTTTIVGPGHVPVRHMTNPEAKLAAEAIRQRAAERNITVEVTTQEIPSDLGHAQIMVKHIVGDR